MRIRNIIALLFALILPFALLSCSDNSTGVEEEEGIDEIVELVYAISFSAGEGVATFFVDVTEVEGFNPETHTVYITGSLLGWPEPGSDADRQTMVLIEDENTEIPVVTPDETGEVQYKYFSDLVGDGWEGGEWAGDPNRTATLEAGAQIQDIWGDQPE